MADPKNKWKQPPAPPAPMFFGTKERELVKQVNDELSERIIGQPIAYYPISLEESDFNTTYGEAIEKVSLPPVRVYAYVIVDNEQTNERYGYEYQTKITVNFSNKRLIEDQNLYVRVGDYVQYGDQFYEIVRLFNDTRYYFGQVEHKFQVSAECIRVREGVFRVMPSVDRPTPAKQEVTADSPPAPRTAPYPPLAASYVTINAETKLPNERVLTAGTGITIVDSGAGGAITISAAGTNAVGPTGSIQFQQGEGIFSGSANLTFLAATNRFGIGTDSPTHNLTIIGNISASTDLSVGGNITASAFYGDGSNLTNVTASAVEVADGPEYSLQFRRDDPITGEISGSANLIFTSDNLLALTGTMEVVGDITSSANVSASAFYGDGSNLKGITTAPAGSDTQLQFNDAGSFSASSNLTYDGSSLSIVGDVTSSANVSASAFYGDGSNLTGISNAAGSNTQIQFNNAGNFAASSKLTYDSSTDKMVLTGTMNIVGGLVLNRTSVTSDYTIALTDYYLGVDTTSNPVTLAMPIGAIAAEGQTVIIKDEGGNANVNEVTIGFASRIDNVKAISISSGNYYQTQAVAALNDNKQETIVAWINNQNPNNLASLLGQADTRGLRVTADNKLEYLVGVTFGPARRFETVNPIPTEEWVHVALTYDSNTQECKIYINGVSVDVTAPSDPAYNDVGWDVGAVNIGLISAGFTGYIADLAIWRTKLTAAEVSDIYNRSNVQLTLDGPQISDLLYWYRMGDNSSDTVTTIVNNAAGAAAAINLVAGTGTTSIITISQLETTPNPTTLDTIDGETSIKIQSPHGSYNLYTDGVSWFIY